MKLIAKDDKCEMYSIEMIRSRDLAKKELTIKNLMINSNFDISQIYGGFRASYRAHAIKEKDWVKAYYKSAVKVLYNHLNKLNKLPQSSIANNFMPYRTDYIEYKGLTFCLVMTGEFGLGLYDYNVVLCFE